jgi:hypothetical protein
MRTAGARASDALDPSGTSDEDEGRPLGEIVRYCVLVFLAVRGLTFAIALIGTSIVPPLDPVGVPGWPAPPLPDPGWGVLFTAWERFDALWFLSIADSGYGLENQSAAFFPLYPIAIRAVSLPLGGHPLAAGLLVSNAAFLGALLMAYRLTMFELDERRARTVVVLLAFFPTAYFFLMPYTESLFLLLVLTAFWGARRGRWGIAAAAGAGAALTRSIGVVLVWAFVAEAVHQREERAGRAWPGLLAAGATGLGLLAYLGWWEWRTDDLLAPITRQETWQRAFSWPWETLWNGMRFAFRFVGNANGGYWMLDWLIVVPFLALTAYAARRYRPAYGVYVVGGLLIPMTFVFGDRPLMSMPRFVLPLFPALWAAAELAERFEVPRWALAAIGGTLMGVLALLTINWYYVF